jgi:hypothetical protein
MVMDGSLDIGVGRMPRNAHTHAIFVNQNAQMPFAASALNVNPGFAIVDDDAIWTHAR